jgi:NAD(P) transhydrogenase subunit alpha
MANFRQYAFHMVFELSHFQKEKIAVFAAANISAFSLELLPRTSRAQAMDVLSSQSNLLTS